MESLAADDMKPDTLLPLFSRSARTMLEKLTPEERRLVELGMSSRRGWSYQVDVSTDMALATLRTSVSGDDALGYRVMAQLVGAPRPMPYYIVKEEGQYRLLGYGDLMSPVAFEMLERIKRQDVDGARMLVAWVRDSVPTRSRTIRMPRMRSFRSGRLASGMGTRAR